MNTEIKPKASTTFTRREVLTFWRQNSRNNISDVTQNNSEQKALSNNLPDTKTLTSELSRREFLKIGGLGLGALGLGVLGKDFLDKTQPFDADDVSFNTVVDYESFADLGIMSSETPLDINKYEKIENWAENWEMIRDDMIRVRNTGLEILKESRSGNLNRAIELIKGLRQLASIGITVENFDPMKAHYIHHDQASNEEEQILFGLVAQNNIKLDAFLVLNTLSRLVPEIEDLTESLAQFDFEGLVSYAPTAKYGLTLFAGASLTNRHAHRQYVLSRANRYLDYITNPDLEELKKRIGFVDAISKEQAVERVEEIFNRIKQHWPVINDSANKYNLDPFLLASILFAEETDVKSGAANDTWLYILRRLENLPEFVKQIAEIITPHLDEHSLDLLATMVGQDASVGLGQTHTFVVKKEHLLKILGRQSTEKTPTWLVGLLLSNNEISIDVTARYVRYVINTLHELERNDQNWYLSSPDQMFGSFDALRSLDFHLEAKPLLVGEYHPGQLDPVEVVGLWYTSAPYGTYEAWQSDKTYCTGTEAVFTRFPHITGSYWGRHVRSVYNFLLASAKDIGPQAQEYSNLVKVQLEELIATVYRAS